MAESNTGKALYAIHQGTYVLKLIGEIRVPICATLDNFIENMFRDKQLNSVLIDLSKTQIIDSTALGLLAKIAIQTRKRFKRKPLIISTEPDVTRILDTMGFEKVFNIVHEAATIQAIFKFTGGYRALYTCTKRFLYYGWRAEILLQY